MEKNYDFNFKLSDESISNLIKNLKDYEENLKSSKDAILKALAEYTKERIQIYISETTGNGGYIPTEELLNSIQIEKIATDMVKVFTDNSYAAFVEFGTGVTGMGGHPKTDEFDWNYDNNSHGEDGWIYRGSDGNFYKTKGEEAHQFMYRAWIDLQEHYMEIVTNVLKERGLIK